MNTFDPKLLIQDLDQTTFIAYLIAIGLSLLFAGLVDLLYRAYFLKDGRGIQVNRAFIIIGPAVTAIFLVIQFSLPLSLGLLGALSFVRFRTPIKEPEEIGFILLVIACSLSCAVFRFEVAFLLIFFGGVVCLIKQYAIFSRWLTKKPRVDIFVTGSLKNDTSGLQELNNVISRYHPGYELVSKSAVEGEVSFHYTLVAADAKKITDELGDAIQGIEWVRSTNILLNP